MNYFDYLRHNRRYHPHGFTDHTKCKYKQQAEGERRRDFMLFDSPDEAREWLYELNGIEAFHVTDPEQIITEFLMSVEARDSFKNEGDPVSKDAYDFACLVFASTCKDIEDRVGPIPFKPGLFLPYDFYHKKRKWLGSSTADQRDGLDNYITLGNLRSFQGHAFGHSPEELYFDIARHEIGHSLTTKEVTIDFMQMKKRLASKGRAGFIETMRRQVSRRAVNSNDEAMADIFAIRFSPSYKPGELCKEFEAFADSMLITQPSDQEKNGNSMDEKPSTSRDPSNLPYGYRICFDPVPDPPEGKIAWYDQELWQYVEFKSYREKAEYAFNHLKISRDWTDALFSHFPNRDWSDLDIDTVKLCYYSLGESIEETVEQVNFND